MYSILSSNYVLEKSMLWRAQILHWYLDQTTPEFRIPFVHFCITCTVHQWVISREFTLLVLWAPTPTSWKPTADCQSSLGCPTRPGYYPQYPTQLFQLKSHPTRLNLERKVIRIPWIQMYFYKQMYLYIKRAEMSASQGFGLWRTNSPNYPAKLLVEYVGPTAIALPTLLSADVSSMLI